MELECLAGHFFTWVKAKGKRPLYCKDHRRFFTEYPSNRIKPNLRNRQEWAEQGKVLDDPDYEKRWTKIWLHTARVVAARGQSWNEVNIDLLERYIRARRLTELHRLYAQDAPYYTTGRGTTRPHPGWAMSEREERKAEKLAVELGLVDAEPAKEPYVPGANGKPQRQYTTALQESAEAHEVVQPMTGPDGVEL